MTDHEGAGCQWGHEDHDTIIVPGHGPAEGLEFEVFVHPGEGGPGYCPATSVVSAQLAASGEWEPEQTAALLPFIDGDTWFIDFGANVGWYSCLAAARGARVLAFEGNRFSHRLLEGNLLRATDNWRSVVAYWTWIDEDSPMWFGYPDKRWVVKSDLEGFDEHAIRTCWKHFESHQVDAALIEMSPVFRPGYPELAQRLVDVGYTPTCVKPYGPIRPDEAADWVANCRQADVLWTLT